MCLQDSLFTRLFDMDNDGAISYFEYLLLVTFLSIPPAVRPACHTTCLPACMVLQARRIGHSLSMAPVCLPTAQSALCTYWQKQQCHRHRAALWQAVSVGLTSSSANLDVCPGSVHLCIVQHLTAQLVALQQL